MKPVLFLILLSLFILFLPGSSIALIPVVSKAPPKVTFGLKLGANFQELNGSALGHTYKAGFTGGAFAGFTKKRIGLQIEGLVSSAKFECKNKIFDLYQFVPGALYSYPPFVNASVLYLNIPVLFEYKLAPRLWLQAGPQFSDMVSAKDNNGNDVKSTFKTSDFSGVLGLQAVLPFHFTLSARYVLGLTNINNNNILSESTAACYNRSIQLAVGFRFL